MNCVHQTFNIYVHIYKIGHFYSRRSLAYNLFPAFAFLSANYRLAANMEKLELKFWEGDQVRIGCATDYTIKQ